MLFTADEPVVLCLAFDTVDVEETVDVEGTLAFAVSTLALSAVSPLVVSADAVSPWEAPGWVVWRQLFWRSSLTSSAASVSIAP